MLKLDLKIMANIDSLDVDLRKHLFIIYPEAIICVLLSDAQTSPSSAEPEVVITYPDENQTLPTESISNFWNVV